MDRVSAGSGTHQLYHQIFTGQTRNIFDRIIERYVEFNVFLIILLRINVPHDCDVRIVEYGETEIPDFLYPQLLIYY